MVLGTRSQDLDIGVPIERHAAVKRRLVDFRNLLSLLGPHAGMPDPRSRRAEVNALLHRLEGEDAS